MNFFPRWFAYVAGSIALIVWVASFIATIALPTFKPDPIVGYAAMVVISSAMASMRGRKQGEQKDSGKP